MLDHDGASVLSRETCDAVIFDLVTKQMGRIAGVYPVFPEPEPAAEELAVD